VRASQQRGQAPVPDLFSFDQIVATEPEKQSVAFPAGGYYVMRDGWTSKSNYLLFHCGPHGTGNCGHAHADALSFELAVNGKTVLVDPGTYTYTGSKEMRDWFRSSQAHNTVTLDGVSSSIPAGPFSWETKARCRLRKWITNEQFDFVSGGVSDGVSGERDGVLERSILFLRGNYWIVRDKMLAVNEHRGDIWFHFESSAKPFLDGALRDAESGLSIRCFGDGSWVAE